MNFWCFCQVKLSLGRGIVEFIDKKDAEKAQYSMDEGQIDGKIVKVILVSDPSSSSSGSSSSHHRSSRHDTGGGSGGGGSAAVPSTNSRHHGNHSSGLLHNHVSFEI